MSTCALSIPYAESIVGATFPTLQTYANATLLQAQEAATALSNFEIASIPITVTFNAPHADGNFTEPTLPDSDIDPFARPADPPAARRFDPVVIRDAGESPPEPSGSSYVYRRPGGQPGAFTVPAPGPAPTLTDVTFPDAPTDLEDRLPDVPDFYALNIPEPPTLLLDEIEFDGIRPPVDFDVPPQTFAFTEVAYSSDLLDQVRTRLAAMGQGGTGLPAAIEQALFDRARGREDMTAAKATQEVAEEFASRGFTEPNGVLARRLLEVRQNNQNQANALNRDLTIRVHDVEIENLRFFVVQGIAFEQMLLSAHLAMEERRFQVARYLHESVLAIFNARIALHNTLVETYKADAQVYRERIQAEIAKAEVYRAEIEGQKAIAEINKSLADRYETQVRGVLAFVEIYVAQVNARRAQIEANATQIEAYRATVQAFGERVRAYEAEWNGYRASVEAELGSVQAADIAARNYATRVGAWESKNRTYIEQARAEIAAEDLNLRAWEGELRRWQSLVDAERTRIASDAQVIAAQAGVYSAAGQIAQAKSAAADRTIQLEIERGRSEAELRLRNGEININQGLQVSGQMLEALKGSAQVLSQLAASLFAALNVSASISSSDSNGTNCSTSYNYSGELATEG